MRSDTNGGITLIALIITVIVMLILAAVAINLTIGDNGIFKKSDKGAQIYKNATNNEAVSLNSVEQEMGNLISKYHGGESNNQGKPDANGIYTENSTINAGEPSAFNPEIPKGFKPIDVDDAVWGDGSTPPTQDSVKKGLVIEDEEGNQFVWIAVDGETVKLDRYTFASDGTETACGETVINSKFQELASSDKGNTVAKDINAFKTSVAEHGGYYIARYEASYGIDGKPNSKVSVGIPSNNSGAEYAPTVEGQLWNNITQPNAAQLCRNMYDSSYGVISDLVNSYAWDTALVFIQKYSGVQDYAVEYIIPSFGNTGVNGDEVCHICNMNDNYAEWSTESSVEGGAVSRFGLVVDGAMLNDCIRASDGIEAKWYIGFRPILYL